MRYFISDLHFYDSGIMAYAERPYGTIEEMNDDLIARFTNKTRDASEVWILGDIFGGRQPDSPYASCRELMRALGITSRPFRLILGNHDHLTPAEYEEIGFRSVKGQEFIDMDGMRVMLTHDPCMVQARNTLAICGHIHTLFSENWQPARNTYTVNVAVEVRNYEPTSEREILELIRRSEYDVKK
ncbi:MAG: metallophosphoesterase family protein [Synergistaceae bacterium]|jgi:calcineurin-like phosphoesterase family protein|nr:metallophosphoesterase family protein [Synergistaceae bacterium]